MRIALNLLPVIPQRTGGQEVYARGIVRGLLELPDLQHDVVLLTNQFNHDTWPDGPRLSRHLVPMRGTGQLGRVFREQHRLPRILRELGVDVVHSIASVAIFRAPCPNVVTIHDLLYLHSPEMFSFGQLAYRRLLVPPTARRASHIVADSDFTREDLIGRLGANPSRVSKVHLGLPAEFCPPAPAEAEARWTALQHRHGIQKPYVFYLGTLSPHKNVETLVRSLAIVGSRGITLELVIAGPAQSDAILTSLDALADSLGVVLRPIGYASAHELPVLYNNATVHVLPSIFEGFGLTVIEAMACGCPVIASRRASIPEVAGDAALLVEPQSAEQFADAIAMIVTDPAVRARLIAAGLDRARLWTWREAARRLVEIYEGAGGALPSG